MKALCELCFHHCALDEGQTGLCRARACQDGKIVSLNYGKLTSLALDPIEKKPLRRFHPGSLILSVGSFGCNLRCPFCQNHEISMAGDSGIQTVEVSPEQLAAKAAELVPHGNIGVAYTYNERYSWSVPRKPMGWMICSSLASRSRAGSASAMARRML